MLPVCVEATGYSKPRDAGMLRLCACLAKLRREMSTQLFEKASISLSEAAASGGSTAPTETASQPLR